MTKSQLTKILNRMSDFQKQRLLLEVQTREIVIRVEGKEILRPDLLEHLYKKLGVAR